jgi:acetyl esterase/lipase
MTEVHVANNNKAHHYAIDAASLLETCISRLQETIARDKRKRHKSLVDMETALATTERLLLAYICQQVDLEREAASNVQLEEGDNSNHDVPPTLLEAIEIFQSVLNVKKHRQELQSRQEKRGTFFRNKRKGCNGTSATIPQQRPVFDHSGSPIDSLLFRLIVTLQLCLVRINDAFMILTGRRYREKDEKSLVQSSYKTRVVGSACCVLGLGSLWLIRSKRTSNNRRTIAIDSHGFATLVGKVALVAVTTKFLVREWGNVWMTTKILKSTADVEEWQQQWLVVQTTGGSFTSHEKSQRLIEYAMSQSPKSSLWHSEGEIRFLLLKRAMDLLYASVGTAVKVTKSSNHTASSEGRRIGWKLPIAVAAAASYYSFFDPSRRAWEAVSSSSLDLIQYAWGMVSLPAIKQLSLQASRLLKGAAIAERITIAGVPCFVLSRDPSPDLSAALVRGKRKRRSSINPSLSTIEERAESELDTSMDSLHLEAHETDTQPRRLYPKKDIILHFTGGGFFAHTLASDIPFLLDWSGATNAIVICPEYSLLPNNVFPVALDQVTNVYCSLVRGDTCEVLGVEADRVIVTGESAGGNLAAALCVKLSLENLMGDTIATMKVSPNDEPLTDIVASNLTTSLSNDSDTMSPWKTRMPDAIMLSCPALNLTLDLSPSRVLGQQDPVLPSGLISAISDAYAPPTLGINKKDPLVSPYYAPDEVLRLFPPILLFASSDDPLLDDSVDFNRRCRSLGVDSKLGAVSHMPHAYWGLGTAGFPEALQVQHECQEWLVQQFSREQRRESNEENGSD